MRFSTGISAAIFGLSMLTAAPVYAQFTGPTQDYTYTGCIDTRACYLLTVTVGPVNNPFPSAIFGDHGATVRLESWYNERGYSYHPLGMTTGFGSINLWDDYGFATKCTGEGSSFPSACVGYVSDNMAYGLAPTILFQNFVIPDKWPGISATFVTPDWTPYGQGSETGKGSTQLVLTPEPSTYALMAGGLAILGALARRRAKGNSVA